MTTLPKELNDILEGANEMLKHLKLTALDRANAKVDELFDRLGKELQIRKEMIGHHSAEMEKLFTQVGELLEKNAQLRLRIIELEHGEVPPPAKAAWS